MVSFNTLKIGSILLIFAESLLFAFLPLKSKKFRGNKLLMSLANSFSAGIFLAAGLLHILPDAHEAFQEKDPKAEADFPYVNFAASMSFSLVFFLDKVAFDTHSILLHEGHGHGDGHHDHHNHSSHKDSHALTHDDKQKHLMEGEEFDFDDEEEPTDRGKQISSPTINSDPGEKVDLNESMYPYVLVLAMGIHASFSGIALGVLDDRGSFFGFLLAILLHKWAEALTIGISFSKSKIKPFRATMMILIFAIATPLGAMVGLFFNGSSGKVKGILLGISAGTFLFISATEIIPEEFAEPKRKGLKFLMFFLGLGFMVFLIFVENWTGG